MGIAFRPECCCDDAEVTRDRRRFYIGPTDYIETTLDIEKLTLQWSMPRYTRAVEMRFEYRHGERLLNQNACVSLNELEQSNLKLAAIMAERCIHAIERAVGR